MGRRNASLTLLGFASLLGGLSGGFGRHGIRVDGTRTRNTVMRTGVRLSYLCKRGAQPARAGSCVPSPHSEVPENERPIARQHRNQQRAGCAPRIVYKPRSTLAEHHSRVLSGVLTVVVSSFSTQTLQTCPVAARVARSRESPSPAPPGLDSSSPSEESTVFSAKETTLNVSVLVLPSIWPP